MFMLYVNVIRISQGFPDTKK